MPGNGARICNLNVPPLERYSIFTDTMINGEPITLKFKFGAWGRLGDDDEDALRQIKTKSVPR